MKKFGFEIKKNFSYDFYKKHFKNINILINQKVKIKLNNPKNFNNWIKKFLKDFQNHINYEVSNSKKIIFVRHLKTKLNDNSFLGQYRNPSILKNKTKIKKKNFSLVFSSPLKRSIETAKKFSNNKIITDKNLMEINYGQAEGLNLTELEKAYPKIKKAWDNGKDASFPDGENTSDVLVRVQKFLSKNKNNAPFMAFTHQVVIRVALSNAFGININQSHFLNIKHEYPYKFYFDENLVRSAIPRKDIYSIFHNE